MVRNPADNTRRTTTEDAGDGTISTSHVPQPYLSACDERSGALLRDLGERNPEALATVVRDHTRDLYRVAIGMGIPAQDAEDLVHDVFLTFLQTLDHFAGRARLRTWLWGILRNKIHEYRHARGRQEVELDNDAGLDLMAPRFDARGRWLRPPADLHRLLNSALAGTAIQSCLQRLPPRQRLIFRLREIEDLDTREICTLLDISATHCGVLIHRARLRLRDCLERAGWTGNQS